MGKEKKTNLACVEAWQVLRAHFRRSFYVCLFEYSMNYKDDNNNNDRRLYWDRRALEI